MSGYEPSLVRNSYDGTKKLVLKKRKNKSTVSFKNTEDKYIADVSDLPPYEMYEPEGYKDGPEGFIKWCEENVSIPIYPEGSDISVWVPINELPRTPSPKTGRSYWDFWENQKRVARNCLRMKDNRFIYRLIILCWMRGEGKSLFACLIQLWKFFNWTRQQIVLGANSKEQITFVHYDIMKDIILNSPPLLGILGKKNIQEKQIRLKDEQDNTTSVIRAISSFSGIVSNITGYTFSEIFDMKNPKFFTQLDGSIRNIPNALGVIDSTVSTKTHILYSLFSSFVKKEVHDLYFSYRYSKNADYRDYWNPEMDQKQLDSYKGKFLLADFERYFKNTWGSVSDKIFTEEMIDSMLYVGCNNRIGNFEEVKNLLSQRKKYKDQLEMLKMEKNDNLDGDDMWLSNKTEIAKIDSKLISVENHYKLTDGFTTTMATMSDLDKLGEIFDTDWAILAGIDRADPMKESKLGARTIFTCVAKGLPGSRTNFRPYDEQGAAPIYLYVLLHLASIESHSTEDIKDVLALCHDEYDGIDTFCGERWGAWDINSICEEIGIKFEIIFPVYAKQKAAFSELYLSVQKGRFKSPIVYVLGSKENDILREEMAIFYHDPDKHWFGSPEKNEKYGVQDDAVFSLAWCIYGGRDLGIEAFRSRKGKMWFGTMVRETGVRLI